MNVNIQIDGTDNLSILQDGEDKVLPLSREAIRETLAKQLKLLSERSALVGVRVSDPVLASLTEAMCSVSELLIRTLPFGQ